MKRSIFFTILLALGLVFLVACNGSDGTSNATQNGNGEDLQTTTPPTYETTMSPIVEGSGDENASNYTDETTLSFNIETHDTDFAYHHADFTLNIAPARDDLLAAFEYLHEFDFYEGYDFYEFHGMEQGDSLVIWADVPLSELWIMTIYPDFLPDRVIYVLSSTYFITSTLLPGQALVVRNYMGLGSFPWSGITFFADGSYRQHYFAKSHNHSDSPNYFGIRPVEVRVAE